LGHAGAVQATHEDAEPWILQGHLVEVLQNGAGLTGTRGAYSAYVSSLIGEYLASAGGKLKDYWYFVVRKPIFAAKFFNIRHIRSK
jgi:hypothetical protein